MVRVPEEHTAAIVGQRQVSERKPIAIDGIEDACIGRAIVNTAHRVLQEVDGLAIDRVGGICVDGQTVIADAEIVKIARHGIVSQNGVGALFGDLDSIGVIRVGDVSGQETVVALIQADPATLVVRRRVPAVDVDVLEALGVASRSGRE